MSTSHSKLYVLIHDNDEVIKPLKVCADKNKLISLRAKLISQAEGADERNGELSDQREKQWQANRKIRQKAALEFFKKNEHAYLEGAQEKYKQEYKKYKTHLDYSGNPTLSHFLADICSCRYSILSLRYEEYFDMRYLHEKFVDPCAPEVEPDYEEEYDEGNLTIHEVEELL